MHHLIKLAGRAKLLSRKVARGYSGRLVLLPSLKSSADLLQLSILLKTNYALKKKATDSLIIISESVAKIRDDIFPKIIYRLASALIIGA